MTILYAGPRWRALGAALLVQALAGCGAVTPQLPEAVAPPSHSVRDADARLASVAAGKVQAEAAFAASEQLCYTRFLVNHCLDKAREKRRATLAGLRAIEIEAERFKRQAKVDERDRDLAEAEMQFQAEAARMAAAPAPAPAPAPVPASASAPAPAPAPVRNRAAAQAAKLNNLDAQDQAGAAQRAAKVQAFEQRQRKAAQRQKEIAEKKKKTPGGEAGK